MNQPELLPGRRLVLRPATPEEERAIYEWLARSDLTATTAGPPTCSERPVPAWDDFRADFADHDFDGSAPDLRTRGAIPLWSSKGSTRLGSMPEDEPCSEEN